MCTTVCLLIRVLKEEFQVFITLNKLSKLYTHSKTGHTQSEEAEFKPDEDVYLSIWMWSYESMWLFVDSRWIWWEKFMQSGRWWAFACVCKRIGTSVCVCFRGWVYRCMSDSKEPQLSRNLSQKSLTNRRERAGEWEGGIEERRSNKREKQERRLWRAHRKKDNVQDLIDCRWYCV